MTIHPLPGDHGAIPTPVAAALALTALAEAAEAYLLTLEHDGAGEVRAILARREGPPDPVIPRANAVAERWLSEALAALEQSHPVLATAIGLAAPHLDWITYDGYPADQIGSGFAQGHAFASILGRRGPFVVPDVSCGLFLIAPQVVYRDHAHAAPELYAPLTGPHGWRFAPGDPLAVLPAHVPVWNPPHKPHLTKVGPLPFLCLYVWTRDAAETAYVISADDWPALEEMRL
ncbi:MAG: hypothetical protein JJT81_05985 [Rubellimicrobium sp.]|nr:hypothetical protein [Rubellimicrobium sp.]